jgi:hypothetical protein
MMSTAHLRLFTASSLFALSLAAFAQGAAPPAAAEDPNGAATLEDDRGAVQAAIKWLELLDDNQLSRAYDQCADLRRRT